MAFNNPFQSKPIYFYVSKVEDAVVSSICSCGVVTKGAPELLAVFLVNGLLEL